MVNRYQSTTSRLAQRQPVMPLATDPADDPRLQALQRVSTKVTPQVLDVAPPTAQVQSVQPQTFTASAATSVPTSAPTSFTSSSARDKMRDAAAANAAGASNARALAELQAQQQRQRTAQEQELAASKQQALLDASARLNLSGGGLTGQASVVGADIGRAQDLSKIEALASFDASSRAAQTALTSEQRAADAARQATRDSERNQQREDQRFKVETWQAEADSLIDIDGDGLIGAPGAPDSVKPGDLVAQQKAEEVVGSLEGEGTRESPIVLYPDVFDKADLYKGLGLRQMDPIDGRKAYVDDAGRVYILKPRPVAGVGWNWAPQFDWGER